MGGAATVPTGRYMSRPDYQTDFQILSQKQGMGNTALDIASTDLNAAQAGVLGTQLNLLKSRGDTLSTARNVFDLQSKMQPLMQDFDAEQTSRQAAQFGLSNEARARQGEELLSPATARMRYQLPEQIEAVTSDESFKNRMDAWLKNKGISSVSGTGVDPSSSFGRSMLADVSTEEGRKRMLEDIELRNKFVTSQQRPIGGLDPSALINKRMTAEAENRGAMSDWQSGILQGAQQLGQINQLKQAEEFEQARQLGSTLDSFQQARMGLNQNAFDYLSKNMGEILNLSNVQKQNRQAYDQSLYNAAVQNAQSQNASKAGMISAGAGIGGAAIGAAAIII
jgi:hypothetical protein